MTIKIRQAIPVAVNALRSIGMGQSSISRLLPKIIDANKERAAHSLLNVPAAVSALDQVFLGNKTKLIAFLLGAGAVPGFFINFEKIISEYQAKLKI